MDEKGTDKKEMAHDNECVDGSESKEDCSSNETVLPVKVKAKAMKRYIKWKVLQIFQRMSSIVLVIWL